MPALVAHTHATGIPGPTPAIDTRGASLLVIAVHYYGVQTFGVSDNQGNAYQALTTYGVDGAAGFCQLFYCFNPTTSAAHTFSCTFQQYQGLSVAAFSGTLAGAGVLDKSNGATTTGSTTIQAGSITPSQAGELIVAAYSDGDSQCASPAIDSGLTILETVHDGSVMNGALACLLSAGSGAINPAWTVSPDTDISAAIASFFPDSGGSGGALAGSSSGVASSVATLKGSGALAANAAGSASSAATLAGLEFVSASATGSSTASATARGTGAVSAPGTGSALASATIAGKGALAGSIAGTASSTAAGQDFLAASGSTFGSASSTATIFASGALAGFSAGTASSTAALGQLGGGVAAGSSTASATLTAKGALAAPCTAASTASATLSAHGTLAAPCTAASTATATLAGSGALAGSSAGISFAMVSPSGSVWLLGSAAGSSTVTAMVAASGTLSSAIGGSSSLTGLLAATGFVAGASYGTANARLIYIRIGAGILIADSPRIFPLLIADYPRFLPGADRTSGSGLYRGQAAGVLYKRNSQVVELPRLRSGLDETQFKNAATATATLCDADGSPISGYQPFPLSLAEGSVDGTYSVRLGADFDPPAGRYRLVFAASESGDDLEDAVTVVVKVRSKAGIEER